MLVRVEVVEAVLAVNADMDDRLGKVEGNATAIPCIGGAEVIGKSEEADVGEMLAVHRLTCYTHMVTHIVDVVDGVDVAGEEDEP